MDKYTEAYNILVDRNQELKEEIARLHKALNRACERLEYYSVAYDNYPLPRGKWKEKVQEDE